MPNNTLRQLDPGTHEVLQGSTVVGQVYAEGTAGSMVVEHWVLYDGFVVPDTTTSMEVIEVSSGYSSLSAFMDAMQDEIDSQGESATYVKATCVYDTIDPT